MLRGTITLADRGAFLRACDRLGLSPSSQCSMRAPQRGHSVGGDQGPRAARRRILS